MGSYRQAASISVPDMEDLHALRVNAKEAGPKSEETVETEGTHETKAKEGKEIGVAEREEA